VITSVCVSVQPESDTARREREYCWSLSGYCNPAKERVGILLEVSVIETSAFNGKMSQSNDRLLPVELLVMEGVHGAQAAAEILKSASGLGRTVTVMEVSSSHPEDPTVTVWVMVYVWLLVLEVLFNAGSVGLSPESVATAAPVASYTTQECVRFGSVATTLSIVGINGAQPCRVSRAQLELGSCKL